MKKKILVLLASAVMGLALAACNVNAPAATATAGAASVAASNSEATASSTADVQEEQTITAVLNRKGNDLVLVTEEGKYFRFDLGDGASLHGLEEGDRVMVTYTGTLEEYSENLVATSVQKN